MKDNIKFNPVSLVFMVFSLMFAFSFIISLIDIIGLYQYPNYIKTQDSKSLLTAIKDNKPNDFISILKDKNNIVEVSEEKRNLIFDIVMKIDQKQTSLLLDYVEDNYLTVNEYNKMKLIILEDLKDKKLNILEKSLIMSF